MARMRVLAAGYVHTGDAKMREGEEHLLGGDVGDVGCKAADNSNSNNNNNNNNNYGVIYY